MSRRDGERRESGRAPIQLPIEYDRLNALLSDYTHNISRGGTFIRTHRPLVVGTVVHFTIRAPALGEPLLLRGVVRWVVDAQQAGEDRPAGMGIAFVYDSPAQKEAIEARLDGLMIESLGEAAFEKLMRRGAPDKP
ncbi:MAG: TIGR02266 family protein [Polyangiales bacterium]